MTTDEKTVTILAMGAMLALAITIATSQETHVRVAAGTESLPEVSRPTQGKDATFDDLLDAIEWVESKGIADAVGDNGKAVGCMQIHKICVDDVNRILGENRYQYEDRLSKVHSRSMAMAYLYYWANEKGFEAAARIWNGGPKGHLKEATKSYWIKIKARMEAVK